MDFSNDPLRERIEPMDEFLRVWADWGREHCMRSESITYKLMCWIRDHSKRVEEIREGIATGERLHIRRDDSELIAWKVERILTHPDYWRGHHRERDILKGFYLAHPLDPAGRIAKVVSTNYDRVYAWQLEGRVKKALLYFSNFWRD